MGSHEAEGSRDVGLGSAATPIPHPTILRRAVLLCADLAPDTVVGVDTVTGICPYHKSTACALWFVPWPDAERAARDAQND